MTTEHHTYTKATLAKINGRKEGPEEHNPFKGTMLRNTNKPTDVVAVAGKTVGHVAFLTLTFYRQPLFVFSCVMLILYCLCLPMCLSYCYYIE